MNPDLMKARQPDFQHKKTIVKSRFRGIRALKKDN